MFEKSSYDSIFLRFVIFYRDNAHFRSMGGWRLDQGLGVRLFSWPTNPCQRRCRGRPPFPGESPGFSVLRVLEGSESVCISA